MSDLACALASLEVDEPLAGTAAESVDRWMLLEVTDPWAPKPLDTAAIPQVARDRLERWLEFPRSRFQLIRRPGRTGKRPLFMVVSSSGQLSRVELDRYEDLSDLDADAMKTEMTDPMVLVCAHGRRDRCCAQHGSAVYRSLQARVGELWQTSHLGGHRFAACVLSLPDGLMYGRLRAEHADDFARALGEREIADLELFRGRCELDRPSQAAEIFWRRRRGDRRADSLEWIETLSDGHRTWVSRFRTAAGDELVRVRLEDMGVMAPGSCGAEPEPVARFVEIEIDATER